MSSLLSSLDYTSFAVAVAAIVLHVVNYNATAQLEHATRCFTRVLGPRAVYYYAVYLVCSALARDYLIKRAVLVNLEHDAKLLDDEVAFLVGDGVFLFGVVLNVWTLHALGIKGMYNGDSFGHLMDAPVTGGPFRLFADPQYVGTTASMAGFSLVYQSPIGYALTLVMGIVFKISVDFVEAPHMARLYGTGKASSSKKKSARQ